MFPKINFEIPGFSNYRITRCGRVFSLIKQEELKGSANPAGYINFRLKQDNGSSITVGLHRLMALTFVPCDYDLTEMVVNHKDGIKSNNLASNLEWVTAQENLEHAGRLGLTSKCLPVYARELESGIVRYFDSAIKAAQFYKVTKDFILYRRRFTPDKIFPENRQYSFGAVCNDWKDVEDSELERLRSTNTKITRVRFLLSNSEKVFYKSHTLASFLGIADSTLSVWLSLQGQPVLPGLIQLKDFFSDEPWRAVSDPWMELDGFGGCRIIKTIDIDGHVSIFENARKCAIANGINFTTLSYRLTQPHRFFNGKRFIYYCSDSVPVGSDTQQVSP